MSGNQGDLFQAFFEIGDRVEIAPHIDRWMRGDRFGEVTKIGKRYVHIKMDMSGGIAMMVPENLRKVS